MCRGQMNSYSGHQLLTQNGLASVLFSSQELLKQDFRKCVVERGVVVIKHGLLI